MWELYPLPSIHKGWSLEGKGCIPSSNTVEYLLHGVNFPRSLKISSSLHSGVNVWQSQLQTEYYHVMCFECITTRIELMSGEAANVTTFEVLHR